jgi:hypothetical protein
VNAIRTGFLLGAVQLMACQEPVLKPPSEPHNAGPLEVPSGFCAAREHMELECPLPNGDVGWCSDVAGVAPGKCKVHIARETAGAARIRSSLRPCVPEICQNVTTGGSHDLSRRVLVYESRYDVPSALRTEVQGLQLRPKHRACLVRGHAVGGTTALS